MRQPPACPNQLGCAGKKQGGQREQTVPPSIPVAELFPDGNFPECERQSYKTEYASFLPFTYDQRPSPPLVSELEVVQLFLPFMSAIHFDTYENLVALLQSRP